MRHLLILLVIVWGTLDGLAQHELQFETELPLEFADYFKSSKKRQFYLSPTGNEALLNTESGYKILDLENSAKLIGEGEHVNKLADLSASAMGAFMNGSLNREDAVNKLTFQEGTEYFVFEPLNVVIFLDWNVDRNVVKAVDLTNGREMWTTDAYRYMPSSNEQFAAQFIDLALSHGARYALPSGVGKASIVMASVGRDVLNSQQGSDIITSFITPVVKRGLIMLKTNDGYVGLDVKTGQEKWTFNDDISIGFYHETDEGDLVLVNFNSSYFKSSKNRIVNLNTLNGSVNWEAEHISDFRMGRTYATNNRLICDYYGAEVFDMKTGKRVLLSIDEKTIKTQNTMSAMFMNQGGQRSTESIASPSILAGNYLYTSTFKLGPRVYANDGSSKAMIQKYDLNSGKQLWNSDKLSKGTDLDFVSDTHVFVRQGKAFGKSSLYVLDAASGKVLAETDNIDGFVYRTGGGDVLTDDYLYRSGKKDIYVYDTKSWKEVGTISRKDLDVGKLIAVSSASDDLLVVGDNGMCIVNADGDVTYKTKHKVESGNWNTMFCFLWSDKGGLGVQVQEQTESLTTNRSPQLGDLVLLSDGGRNVLIIQNEHNDVGKKKALYYRY